MTEKPGSAAVENTGRGWRVEQALEGIDAGPGLRYEDVLSAIAASVVSDESKGVVVSVEKLTEILNRRAALAAHPEAPRTYVGVDWAVGQSQTVIAFLRDDGSVCCTTNLTCKEHKNISIPSASPAQRTREQMIEECVQVAIECGHTDPHLIARLRALSAKKGR